MSTLKKITPAALVVPPYVSTSWRRIASLTVQEGKEGKLLGILMEGGERLEVPGLTEEEILLTFQYHSRGLEEQDSQRIEGASQQRGQLDDKSGDIAQSIVLPLLRLTQGEGAASLLSLLQQATTSHTAPVLPAGFLNKIHDMIKSMGLGELYSTGSQCSSGCRCLLCQLVQVRMHREEGEEVAPEELHFREWDVRKEGDKLYTVTHVLDHTESYQVYLGLPIGCTCGRKECDHMRTVLRTRCPPS